MIFNLRLPALLLLTFLCCAASTPLGSGLGSSASFFPTSSKDYSHIQLPPGSGLGTVGYGEFTFSLWFKFDDVRVQTVSTIAMQIDSKTGSFEPEQSGYDPSSSARWHVYVYGPDKRVYLEIYDQRDQCYCR